jgi:hypothetical protein
MKTDNALKTAPATVLENIMDIVDDAKECKLNPDFIRKHKPQLKHLSKLWSLTEQQALFVCLVFYLNMENDSGASIKDIAQFLGCSVMQFLMFHKDFSFLLENKFLYSSVNPDCLPEMKFKLFPEIHQVILSNEKVTGRGEKKMFHEILREVHEKGCAIEQNYISRSDFNRFMEKFLEQYGKEPAIEKLLSLKLSMEFNYAFLDIAYHSLTDMQEMNLNLIFEGLFPFLPLRINILEKFLNDSNPLLAKSMVEIIPSEFISDTGVRLTRKSIAQFVGEDNARHYFSDIPGEGIIASSTITEKKLFYNRSETKQLEQLARMLQEKSLAAMRARMKKHKLTYGIIILLYGAPGTGKTETVFQIARKTGRNIYQVDISESKSMWYGETEKTVKKIFLNYYAHCKSQQRMPVLLFNEADAILSKRTEDPGRAVDKTGNTVQNILLEEMERFKGIMFATSNLIKNFDHAFERRFLYKIQLSCPDAETKKKIWQSKFPFLKPEVCRELAKTYDFTGGQIDNVLRRYLCTEIIHGKKTALTQLHEFCREESLNEKRPVMGYKNNNHVI